MSKNEERERQRMMSLLPNEGEVAAEIFAAMSTVGERGSTISPDLAALASQVAGAEAAGRWLKAGHSMDDCGMVRRFYEYVGNHSERTLRQEDVSTARRFQIATTTARWSLRQRIPGRWSAASATSPLSTQIPRH
jgi:hypothetical protein